MLGKMNLPNFEASGTPVDKLNGTFGLDGSNSSVHLLMYEMISIH